VSESWALQETWKAGEAKRKPSPHLRGKKLTEKGMPGRLSLMWKKGSPEWKRRELIGVGKLATLGFWKSWWPRTVDAATKGKSWNYCRLVGGDPVLKVR